MTRALLARAKSQHDITVFIIGYKKIYSSSARTQYNIKELLYKYKTPINEDSGTYVWLDKWRAYINFIQTAIQDS